jgi:lipopolysaccharide/colanic/teichoic acid biosynthesis glycosyltransferase
MAMSGEPTVSRTLWARFGKPVFDPVAATLLLVTLSPVLLLSAALIKLTTRGPLFFVQQRGGQHGQSFRLVKFRTMRADRTPDPAEIVRLDHADITAVGWFLRRLKIDELPQLLNVLAGDMSLVGPRPTLLDQVAAYDGFQRQRLTMRPGITGLAQVYAGAHVSWDERILFDVAYVRRCSLTLDGFILGRTLWVMLFGERLTTRPFHQTRYARFVKPDEVAGEGEPRR